LPELTGIETVRKTIEKWLEDEDFTIWKFPDENAHFSYKTARDDCLPLLIYQPRHRTDSIQVSSDVRLSKEDHKKLHTIRDRERFLLFDFKMVLLSTACNWQFIPSVDNWRTLRVSKAVFYDGLSKDKFFETVEAVARAVSTVMVTFQWKFDITPVVS
jgi:hypothetical protein